MALLTNDTDPFSDGSLLSGYNLDINANDYVGLIDGTATSITYSTGHLADSGVFNDTDSRIDVLVKGVKTISMFVYRDSTKTGQSVNAYVLDGRLNTGGSYFLMGVNDELIGSTGLTYTIDGLVPTVFPLDQWVHVIIELDALTDDFTLGHYQGAGDYALGGGIDQAMMFDRVLTAEEKTALKNMELAPSGVSILFNGIETTQVFFNGTELTEAHFNGTLLQ